MSGGWFGGGESAASHFLPIGIAPGFLRKIFEFRNADDSKAVPPYSSPTR